MVIRPDGTTRTSGWTFHAEQDQAKRHGPVASSPTPREEVLRAIEAIAARHGDHPSLKRLDIAADDWALLFRAMIEAESAYRPAARSPKGAYGLGQLMPETAQLLGVDPTDIHQNLDGAARYLLAQIDRFGRVDLALAAYNAGPHRVVEYSGIPPFAETRGYIARIGTIYARLAKAGSTGALTLSSKSPAEPSLNLLNKGTR
jgi:hypothetical protein